MAYKQPVVQIDGLKELRKTLRQAGDDMTDLKTANLEAAGIVASSTTPPWRTGALAGSIRSAGTKTAGIIRAGRAAIPYAGPIHWGWPDRNIPANPFLSDAATSTEPAWLPAYLRRLEEILDNIKGA